MSHYFEFHYKFTIFWNEKHQIRGIFNTFIENQKP